jgi:MFS family permease
MGFKSFEKGELRLLWPFYLEYFLASLLFFMPAFLVPYFTSLGISAFQMGLLLAIWPLSALIFEIPTGAFADLYGRKASVLLGYFIEAVVMISLFFFKSYPTLLFLFALLGFGATFSSGSKDAWIVDSIKMKKGLVHQFFSKMQFFIHSGIVLSGIIGAILVKQFGLSVIWLSTFCSYIFSIFLLYVFTTEKRVNVKTSLIKSFINLKAQAKKSLSYSYNHHVLFYLIFAMGITGLAMNFQAGISWILFLKSLGMQEYQFGYMWSAMGIVMALAPFLSGRLLKKANERKIIIAGLTLTAIVTALILFITNIITALSVMIISLAFYSMKTPSEEVYFHRFIPSKLRATIGSVRNMFFSIITVIALPIAGFLVDKIGSRYTIFISALLIVPAILIYLRIKDK